MMEGGYDAVRLRVAEQYVAQFGQLVQGTTNLVLPANIADMGGMIALAMNVFNQQSVKGAPAKS
jgi:predicted metalloendopeptidase